MWILLFLLARAGAQPSPKPVTAAVAAESSAWQATLEKVVPAVVSIRINSTRAFDTEGASTSIATGFIVDDVRGLILTNRHVVTPGPVTAEAVLLDNEEIPIWPVYRDPVHDFGIYRYNPEDVRYMTTGSLELAPDAARVGMDIRVVGNDAGEKISILAGTLARLDRAAPSYGRGNYNDFNTFYYQAASSTSGGSSGSPVVNLKGHVVALNAGGATSAASSFYLPLHRVKRALDLVREGKPVARGTLQTVFSYEPYDEVRRLGVQAETEALFRRQFTDATGMLVVSETVPAGPGDGKLQPGDVLLSVDGLRLSTFLALEEILDDHVGASIPVVVERGGTTTEVTLTVQDLHSITPDRYLEYSGGVVHALSYQLARSFTLPVGAPYVVNSGYGLASAGIGGRTILTEVDGTPVTTLDELSAALASFPDGAQVPVRFYEIADPSREQVAVLDIDRTWFAMQTCVRDDTSGTWPCTPAPPPPEQVTLQPATARFPEPPGKAARALAPSLVMVGFDIPFRVEGVYGTRYVGTGLVVDAERGIVVCDRDTVPVALGDAKLTFAGSVEIPARVLALHPMHNVAFLQYDPALLGDTPVKSAVLLPGELEEGARTWQVGLARDASVLSRASTVARRAPLVLPLPSPPFFRETNLEVVAPADSIATSGGVLADKKGRVRALWASFVALDGEEPNAFFQGMPIEVVTDVLGGLQRDGTLAFRTLGAELVPLALSEARKRGLSDVAARDIAAVAKGTPEVLMVARLTAGTAAADVLREGDLVLGVDGQLVTTFADFEDATQADAVAIRVLRRGEELDLTVPTHVLDGQGTERALMWGGLLLHAPHRALAAQRGTLPEGVYVAWYWYGSPAARDGVRPTRRIVAVDDIPTPDLDSFLAAVQDKGHRDAVRLKTIDLDGRVRVTTLQLDMVYWPTAEIVRTDKGWERVAR